MWFKLDVLCAPDILNVNVNLARGRWDCKFKNACLRVLSLQCSSLWNILTTLSTQMVLLNVQHSSALNIVSLTERGGTHYWNDSFNDSAGEYSVHWMQGFVPVLSGEFGQGVKLGGKENNYLFDNPFHLHIYHFEYWIFVPFHVINTFTHVLFLLIFIYYMVYCVIFICLHTLNFPLLQGLKLTPVNPPNDLWQVTLSNH